MREFLLSPHTSNVITLTLLAAVLIALAAAVYPRAVTAPKTSNPDATYAATFERLLRSARLLPRPGMKPRLPRRMSSERHIREVQTHAQELALLVSAFERKPRIRPGLAVAAETVAFQTGLLGLQAFIAAADVDAQIAEAASKDLAAFAMQCSDLREMALEATR